MVANLGSQPRQAQGRRLAGYGFWVSAPGLLAANLGALAGRDFDQDGVSFVAEENAPRIDVWVYAHPNEEVAVLLPTPRPIQLSFDGGYEVQSSVQANAHRFRLPGRSSPSEQPASNVRYLWHAVTTVK